MTILCECISVYVLENNVQLSHYIGLKTIYSVYILFSEILNNCLFEIATINRLQLQSFIPGIVSKKKCQKKKYW